MKTSMIRNFDVKDLEDVVEIENRSFPKTPYHRDTVLKYSAMYSGSFLVHEQDNRVIGYLIFEPGGHIISMAVHPSHRRKGIGTGLIKHILGKVKKAWIEVKSSNTNARKFYESLGFREKGDIRNYYRTGDRLIMVYEND